jgi:hypothetical protein
MSTHGEDAESKKGFKVEDRRRFSETGDPRTESVDGAAPSAHPDAQPPGGENPAAEPPFEMSFSTFILSLSTQALAHLGEIPHPVDARVTVDLGAAKQLIDILGILERKTTGNLDATESNLLEHVLYDLRIKYVECVRRTPSQGPR